jgi:hypothetical protein
MLQHSFSRTMLLAEPAAFLCPQLSFGLPYYPNMIWKTEQEHGRWKSDLGTGMHHFEKRF